MRVRPADSRRVTVEQRQLAAGACGRTRIDRRERRRHAPRRRRQICRSGSAADWCRTWTVELLATLTDEGRPRPSLAERLDGQSGRPVARPSTCAPDVKFHDGSPLTATVVARCASSACCRTPWDRRSKTSTASRRSATSRSSSGFDGPRRSCWTRSKRPIQQAGLVAGRHRALRRRRSEVPDRTEGEQSLSRSAGRGSIASSFRRFRACAPRGRNCCAAGSTCCTKSGIDALDSLETVHQRLGVHSHAPLSVHRRPEHAIRRASARRTSAGR